MRITFPDQLTIRDYFAGQALMGIQNDNDMKNLRYEDVAIMAYGVADAMMTERAKTNKDIK